MSTASLASRARDATQTQSSIATWSEIRDGMRIDWDAAIPMDDGVVLRCDVFRPERDGRYAVLLSAGPYGKGLAFQERAPYAWDRLVSKYPEVTAGSSCKYANWEVVDPEQWVSDGYAVVGVGERGARSRVTGALVASPPSLAEETLAKNRCDLVGDAFAHPLADAYHAERSPVWENITVPVLSAANWGGQGIHPRGNFEGFV